MTRTVEGRGATMEVSRRLPVGAEVLRDGVHFRVWAPRRRRMEVVVQGGPGCDASHTEMVMSRDADGYFSAFVPHAAAGSLYCFRLDGHPKLLPDPASRFQPEGPHGPSRVEDARAFTWSDDGWSGVKRHGSVLYEMHIGTFTHEGSWRSAAGELPRLAELGVTLIELMPVAEFPGRFGWGYDGVDLFAPTRLYGEPDDFRRFVDSAHAAGIGVILDVVYNHFGPDGNYLREFSDHYFTDRYRNDWGEPINFDGEHSGPVREFFVSNAGYWIEEFHLDGLRLDATQQIFDASRPHIIHEVVSRARARAGSRTVLIVAENEPQDSTVVRSTAAGGYGADAAWNDDFHHTARVALTGFREAYYTDYLGTPQELLSAMKWGFLYQGQRYAWQRAPRGTASRDLPPETFVVFVQNHDQVANSARGERIHLLTSPGRHRAMTALLLLGPCTPMLFQGQEFSASAPFVYFADHEPELAERVREGRHGFLRQFASLATAESQRHLAIPHDPATFESCILDHTERERHAPAYRLHRDLLRIRSADPVLRREHSHGDFDGAVLAERALLLRYFSGDRGDRLLIVNLGPALSLDVLPEPLLAPPTHATWTLHWSSEDPAYGGAGTPQIETEDGWRIPAESALLLVPGRRTAHTT